MKNLFAIRVKRSVAPNGANDRSKSTPDGRKMNIQKLDILSSEFLLGYSGIVFAERNFTLEHKVQFCVDAITNHRVTDATSHRDTLVRTTWNCMRDFTSFLPIIVCLSLSALFRKKRRKLVFT